MDVDKTIEFLLQQPAVHDAALAAGQARHDAEMTEIREIIRRNEERFNRQDQLLKQHLDRAVRLSLEEHRRERRRRKAEISRVDAAIASLAQSVERFINASQNGRNGNPEA